MEEKKEHRLNKNLNPPSRCNYFFSNLRSLETPIQIIDDAFNNHPIAKFCAFYFLDILVHPSILYIGNAYLSTIGIHMTTLLPISMVSLTIVAMSSVLIAYPIAEGVNYLAAYWIKNNAALTIVSNAIRLSTHLAVTAYIAGLHGVSVVALFSLYTAGVLAGLTSLILVGLMTKLCFDSLAERYELIVRPSRNNMVSNPNSNDLIPNTPKSPTPTIGMSIESPQATMYRKTIN